MKEYVSYNGKKLRKGYTTGTCATAATQAALLMLLKQELVHQVIVATPSGTELTLAINNQCFDSRSAKCSVTKDGGDDQDATHGLEIYSQVSFTQGTEIQLTGGEGIGRVTQAGLPLPVGEHAINPVPRQMILEAVRSLVGDQQGVRVEISAPGGEEIALSTYNPRLGIVGGISILGTSGIVTPMSEEGWKQAITLEMEQKQAQGLDRIILTPGNYGEDFIKEETRISSRYIVQMSNFVGYVLMEAMRLKFKHILLVGHLGKFIKLAGGIFATHSKDADARNEIMIANLALMGAPLALLQQVDQAITTEDQAAIIMEAGYTPVYQRIVDKIQERVLRKFEFQASDIQVDVITFLSKQPIRVSTQPLEVLEEAWS